MDSKIFITAINAVDDVHVSDFLNELKTWDYIRITPVNSNTRGFGEFVITILNSVGAVALIKAIRDFFSFNTIELAYTDSAGNTIEVRARGKDVKPEAIVGYVTGNLSKQSNEEIRLIDYPLELKLGFKKGED